ncbi:LYR motif-containing protein [Sporobolomyces koalae]|uniref:LYR motif-containing protein n=1 Tax=Sporobolomyces koalae TaxID=500713 RepID=UPI00316DE2F5
MELAAKSRSLYRSLLRTAQRMPDDHRRALIVFRARSEFDKSRSLTAPDEIQERQLEGEIYRDQLEYQAEHLVLLSKSSNLLIPVDIRSSPISSSTPTARKVGPNRPNQPSRPPRSVTAPLPQSEPIADPPTLLDRRKLLRAFASRKEGAVRGRSGRNRFMQGPEPSWILKKQRKAEQAATQEGPESEGERTGRHEKGCGCASH